MWAYRLFGPGDARSVSLPVPEPGAGEIRLRVAGTGLCHSDLGFIAAGTEVPYTLGHETAGWIDRLGPEVGGWQEGEAVVASAHWWCGRCAACRRGDDHLCEAQAGGPGYGFDGGLAEYAVLPASSLVALGTVEPATAGPLADAAATAYRVVRRVLPRLGEDATVAVIGAGGLGGCAVQLLCRTTPAHVVAVDPSAERRTAAVTAGARLALAHVDDLEGRCADAVLDFVGTDATLAAAARAVRPGGAVALVGAAGGRLAVGWGSLPPECTVRVCLGNTMADLRAVVALAAAGELVLPVDRFPAARVDDAYAALRDGSVHGRAVVVPG